MAKIGKSATKATRPAKTVSSDLRLKKTDADRIKGGAGRDKLASNHNVIVR